MPAAPTDTSPLHASRSAARALALLDTVVSRGSIGLSEAAGAVDIPTSTALRHLRALMQSGYLLRDELGRYSVGPTFLRLALASFRAGPYARLITAAQPQLERLATATEESVYLAVRDGVEAVYVATVESPRAIRHVGWVGRSVPLDGTAVGDALVAEPGSRRVHVNTGAIEPDVTALTTAIDDGHAVIAALSILGPADRLTGTRREQAGTALLDAADQVARTMTVTAGGDR